MVYVQDIDGKPMMPTTRHGKVRRLLKDNKAVVVNTCPFTIKLTYKTSDYKQEIVLGVDAGTKHVGLSATTKSKELHKMKILKGGKKKNNQAPFEVFGFRLFDKVLYNNEICFIYGRRKSGCFDIRDFDGKNSKNVTYKKLKLIRGKRYPIILK